MFKNLYLSTMNKKLLVITLIFIVCHALGTLVIRYAYSKEFLNNIDFSATANTQTQETQVTNFKHTPTTTETILRFSNNFLGFPVFYIGSKLTGSIRQNVTLGYIFLGLNSLLWGCLFYLLLGRKKNLSLN